MISNDYSQFQLITTVYTASDTVCFFGLLAGESEAVEVHFQRRSIDANNVANVLLLRLVSRYQNRDKAL